MKVKTTKKGEEFVEELFGRFGSYEKITAALIEIDRRQRLKRVPETPR